MNYPKIRKLWKHNLNPITGYRYTRKGDTKAINKVLIKKNN